MTDPRTGATQVVQEWDKLTNLPDSIAGAARGLEAGVAYRLSLVSSEESKGEKVYVAGPHAARKTVLRSSLGGAIDYYFTYEARQYGASLDSAIKGYRQVTGIAPLYGAWAYGFWQCKEHYAHQDELLAAAATFRAKQIPLDAIVQVRPGRCARSARWPPLSALT